MKNKPTVDVIIPTYNGLPYLKYTIDSVLKQTYNNLLIYVIDDGSTDNTERYIKSLKDPRIVYKKKKNGGQATARNLGIKISKSPYVCFLDSDDIWYKTKLSEQIKMFEMHPDAGMVYGLHYLIDSKDKKVGRVTFCKNGRLFNYLLSGNKISGSASMVMLRREVFNNVGSFHEDFLIGEDWEMWLRVAEKYTVYCVPKFLAGLRQLDNAMQRNYLKMATGLDYMLPIMIDEFKPNFIGRAKLTGACLYDAAVYYYMGGDFKKARKDFIKLLISNPFRIKARKDLWIVYLRILLSSELLRKIRRTISPGYRARERAHKASLEKR